MKPLILALTVALAAFGSTAARADHSSVNVGFGMSFASPAVVAAPAPAYCPPAATVVAPVSNFRYVPAPGHWEDVTVKTWIPGRWVTSRDRWGRPVRFFEEGRFAFRTERVWVDSRRDSGYGYNYNGGWNR